MKYIYLNEQLVKFFIKKVNGDIVRESKRNGKKRRKPPIDRIESTFDCFLFLLHKIISFSILI